MSFLRRLGHALSQTEHRPVVQTGVELRQQAEVVRAEAERMVDVVNRNTESGIWPQDLMRGTYRVNRRTVRHDQHP
jgi:hypothetical protein